MPYLSTRTAVVQPTRTDSNSNVATLASIPQLALQRTVWHVILPRANIVRMHKEPFTQHRWSSDTDTRFPS